MVKLIAGIHALPRSSTDEPLMNPRDVSLKVFPDVFVKDPMWNVITLQWGQVVAHDMSFTADVPQPGKYLNTRLFLLFVKLIACGPSDLKRTPTQP